MNKLNNVNVIWKFPKSITGRTKCSRVPHAARVFETSVLEVLIQSTCLKNAASCAHPRYSESPHQWRAIIYVASPKSDLSEHTSMLYTYKCFFDCTSTDRSNEVETEELNKKQTCACWGGTDRYAATEFLIGWSRQSTLLRRTARCNKNQQLRTDEHRSELMPGSVGKKTVCSFHAASFLHHHNFDKKWWNEHEV